MLIFVSYTVFTRLSPCTNVRKSSCCHEKEAATKREI